MISSISSRCLQFIVFIIVIDLQGLALPHLAPHESSQFSKSLSANVTTKVTAVNGPAGAVDDTASHSDSNNNQSFNTDRGQRPDRPRRKAEVSFPDDSTEDVPASDDYSDAVTSSRLSEHTPECAIPGQTYCEDVDEYPAQHINVLMSISRIKQLLHNHENKSPLGVSQRIGSSHGEIVYCASRTAVIFPKLALTINNHWSYIVNQAQFLQGVQVELCAHRNQCRFADRLPFGFRSQCMQQFGLRQLLALDSNGNAMQEYFRMPSHCQCILKPVW